jgi:hypothetical protein
MKRSSTLGAQDSFRRGWGTVELSRRPAALIYEMDIGGRLPVGVKDKASKPEEKNPATPSK